MTYKTRARALQMLACADEMMYFYNGLDELLYLDLPGTGISVRMHGEKLLRLPIFI